MYIFLDKTKKSFKVFLVILLKIKKLTRRKKWLIDVKRPTNVFYILNFFYFL